MLDWAIPRGIGFSQVVSLGDMADVDFGDILDYLAPIYLAVCLRHHQRSQIHVATDAPIADGGDCNFVGSDDHGIGSVAARDLEPRQSGEYSRRRPGSAMPMRLRR
jgi:Succinyl-CoA ligase like flavodoxin domain